MPNQIELIVLGGCVENPHRDDDFIYITANGVDYKKPYDNRFTFEENLANITHENGLI